MSHMRIFGTTAYIHIPKELRKKLAPKSRKGIFMGYSATSKAYRIWNNELQRIDESRDVLFDDDLTDKVVNKDQMNQWLGVEGDIPPPVSIGVVDQIIHVPAILPVPQLPVVEAQAPPGIEFDDKSNAPDPSSSDDFVAVNDHHMDDLRVFDPPIPVENIDARSPSPPIEPIGNQADLAEDDLPIPRMRIRNPPTRLGEWIYPVNRNSYACMARTEILDEPENYAEAMASPEKEQ